MRHPFDALDAALDRHPDYPPGFRPADLERGHCMEDEQPDTHRFDKRRWVWVDVMQLQYTWICLALC
jgi:hypothetical protein